MEARKMPTNAEQVLDALDVLSDSPDTALEVIDKKLLALEAEIGRYRRLRRMVQSTVKVDGPSKAALDKYKAIGDKMVPLLKGGPMRASALAAKLKDVSYFHVGKAAAVDSRFKRTAGGLIALAEKS
jgi:hypothetical protein